MCPATAAYNRLPHNTGRYGNIQCPHQVCQGLSDDALLVVPSATAPIDHRRQSKLLCHLKNDHDSNYTTTHSNGKHSLGPVWRTCQKVLRRRPSSLSTKSAKSLKSDFFQISCWCCELTWLPSFEAKPRIMKLLRVTSSAIPSSPVLSSSLPTSPCPVGGKLQSLKHHLVWSPTLNHAP